MSGRRRVRKEEREENNREIDRKMIMLAGGEIARKNIIGHVPNDVA